LACGVVQRRASFWESGRAKKEAEAVKAVEMVGRGMGCLER
jgi:hypothetical protein